jgi:hypothetical protein
MNTKDTTIASFAGFVVFVVSVVVELSLFVVARAPAQAGDEAIQFGLLHSRWSFAMTATNSFVAAPASLRNQLTRSNPPFKLRK